MDGADGYLTTRMLQPYSTMWNEEDIAHMSIYRAADSFSEHQPCFIDELMGLLLDIDDGHGGGYKLE